MLRDFGQYIDNKMYKLILLIFCIIVYSNIYAQDLSGSGYSNDEGNYVYFSSDMLSFRLITSTGLGDVIMVGYGRYKIKKNKIIVKTTKYPDINSITNSSYVINRRKTDKKYDFLITDNSNQPLTGVNVYYNVNRWKSEGKQTDNNGKLELCIADMPVDSAIEIRYIGYQPLRIPINDLYGVDFSVHLSPGNYSIVEDQRIYLTFVFEGNDILVNYLRNTKTNKLTKQLRDTFLNTESDR